MKGRRVYPRADGRLYLQEGDYGFDALAGFWQVRPPRSYAGGIPKAEVTEHLDGTITVSSPILHHDFDGDGNPMMWHGYLKHGEWREAKV